MIPGSVQTWFSMSDIGISFAALFIFFAMIVFGSWFAFMLSKQEITDLDRFEKKRDIARGSVALGLLGIIIVLYNFGQS